MARLQGIDQVGMKKEEEALDGVQCRRLLGFGPFSNTRRGREGHQLNT